MKHYETLIWKANFSPKSETFFSLAKKKRPKRILQPIKERRENFKLQFFRWRLVVSGNGLVRESSQEKTSNEVLPTNRFSHLVTFSNGLLFVHIFLTSEHFRYSLLTSFATKKSVILVYFSTFGQM